MFHVKIQLLRLRIFHFDRPLNYFSYCVSYTILPWVPIWNLLKILLISWFFLFLKHRNLCSNSLRHLVAYSVLVWNLSTSLCSFNVCGLQLSTFTVVGGIASLPPHIWKSERTHCLLTCQVFDLLLVIFFPEILLCVFWDSRLITTQAP